jgi:hypothetical protein
MRDDTTTDDEDASTTEHTHEHADKQTEHSSPAHLPGTFLGEADIKIVVDPDTYERVRDAYQTATDAGYNDPFDVFAENYTLDGSVQVVVADRKDTDGFPPHVSEAVLRAVENLTWTQDHGGAYASDCLDVRDGLQAVAGDIDDDDLADRLSSVIGKLHEADGPLREPEAVASEALQQLAPLATWVARHRPISWDGAPPAGVDVTEDATLRIDAGELNAFEVTVPTGVMMEAVNSDEPTEAVLDAALTDLVDIEYIASTSDSEGDT